MSAAAKPAEMAPHDSSDRAIGENDDLRWPRRDGGNSSQLAMMSGWILRDLYLVDSGGFIYLNPEIFKENFAQDVDPAEADLMAIVQKPFNQSIFGAERAGAPPKSAASRRV